MKNSLSIKVIIFVAFAVTATSAIGWLTFYVVGNLL